MSSKDVDATLKRLIKQVQEQESTMKQLSMQIQQQQELLNRVLRGTGLLPPQPQISLLEKLDMDKLTQIVTFIGGLYTNNSNEGEDQQKSN
jgi:protein-arginine kinase